MHSKEEIVPRNYSIPVYRVALVRESGLSASEEEVITPVIAAEIALALKRR